MRTASKAAESTLLGRPTMRPNLAPRNLVTNRSSIGPTLKMCPASLLLLTPLHHLPTPSNNRWKFQVGFQPRWRIVLRPSPRKRSADDVPSTRCGLSDSTDDDNSILRSAEGNQPSADTAAFEFDFLMGSTSCDGSQSKNKKLTD